MQFGNDNEIQQFIGSTSPPQNTVFPNFNWVKAQMKLNYHIDSTHELFMHL